MRTWPVVAFTAHQRVAARPGPAGLRRAGVRAVLGVDVQRRPAAPAAASPSPAPGLTCRRGTRASAVTATSAAGFVIRIEAAAAGFTRDVDGQGADRAVVVIAWASGAAASTAG